MKAEKIKDMGDAVAIKTFLEMSLSEAREEIMPLPKEDKEELGELARQALLEQADPE